MPSLSVIVITRDRGSELVACLESIYRQKRQPDEIIIVDDASAAPQETFVRKVSTDAIVIRNSRPLGVPGARNVGIQHSRGNYLVFLDDDAVFGHSDVLGSVETLFESRPQVGILAFRIVNAHTGSIRPYEFPHRKLHRVDEEFETTYFVGAGHAIRKSLFDQIGLLYSEYFYGFEEIDFSWRALQAGYVIQYVPDLLVYHRASVSARPSWRKVYFQTRNRIWFSATFLPVIFILTHLLVWMPFFFLSSIRIGRPDMFVRGLWDGLRGLGRIRKRRAVERLSRSTIRKIAELKGRLFY